MHVIMYCNSKILEQYNFVSVLYWHSIEGNAYIVIQSSYVCRLFVICDSVQPRNSLNGLSQNNLTQASTLTL